MSTAGSIKSSSSKCSSASERSLESCAAGVGANFMTAYLANCKEMGLHPVPTIRLAELNLSLELLADHIKTDDWKPILKSLCSDRTLHCLTIKSKLSSDNYLEHVDTETKVRELKKGSALFTKFTMSCLMEALGRMLTLSKSLATLQLHKLPLHPDLIAILAKGLTKSKSLQNFSIQHAPLGDDGVSLLCRAIRNRPNVTTLELINCNITSVGAEHISRLIKFQELERFGESWKRTLRYRDVDHNILPGLRRITLNNNEKIGDTGLKLIADILMDDFWIKAIDMQQCGLTEEGAKCVLELAKRNSEIVIFDVRKNAVYDFELLKSIVLTLGLNSENDDGDYQWLEIDSLLPRSKSCTNLTDPKSGTDGRVVYRRPRTSNVGRVQSCVNNRAHQGVSVSRKAKTLPPPERNRSEKWSQQPKKTVSVEEKKTFQNSLPRSNSVGSISRRVQKGSGNIVDRGGGGDGGRSEVRKTSIESLGKPQAALTESEIIKNRERLIARLNQMGTTNSNCEEMPRVPEFEEVRERYSAKPFTVCRPTELLALVGGESILGLKRPLFGTDRRAPPLRPT